MSDDIPVDKIRTLNDYQDEAFKTAVFAPEIGPLYCVMGALGESGELASVVIDYYTGCLATVEITDDLQEILDAVEDAVEACVRVERLKKLARKGKLDLPLLPPLNDQVKERIKSEQGDCLWYQAGVGAVSGHTLEDVAQSNISKLRERRDAGVIASAGETLAERKANVDGGLST